MYSAYYVPGTMLVFLPEPYPSLLSHLNEYMQDDVDYSENLLTPKAPAVNREGSQVSKAMHTKLEKESPVLENILSLVKDKLLR